MNCQEFESRVETFARGALADARQLAEASAHEESCEACAAMLADERALSTGLRALASGMRGVEAPPSAEASLLAAFRARAAREGGEDLSRVGANVIPLTARASARQWSWVKTAAVASLAAAASLALFVLARPGFNQSAMIEPPPGALHVQKTPEVAKVNPKVNQGDVEEVNRGEVEQIASPTPEERPARQTLTPRARVMNASYGSGGGGGRAAKAKPAADARPQEIATEFIPLGQYAPAEEGHLVRVELPRSALASFGLPVNAEAAAGGRVKADVLLGEDGTARAIRFIR
jgi:hypothetical protein